MNRHMCTSPCFTVIDNKEPDVNFSSNNSLFKYFKPSLFLDGDSNTMKPTLLKHIEERQDWIISLRIIDFA